MELQPIIPKILTQIFQLGVHISAGKRPGPVLPRYRQLRYNTAPCDVLE